MASANRVIFDIIANTKEYSDGLKKINKDTEKVTKAMKASFVVVSTAIIGSTIAFASYETALKKVGKTTGIEGKALNDFGKEIIKISERIPLSTTRLLELSASAAQLGIKGKKNILLFTETMAKLQTATDIAGEEGAKAISRFLNVTGEGAKGVVKFGAVITDLGNKVAATEAEILHMSERVAQNTVQFNLGSTNVLAISAALKELGFEAELAGTAMGKTFKALQSAVFEGGQSLETLIRITGKTREELKQTFEKDATQSFQTFIDALAKLPANEVISSLKEMGLGGERISSIIATLSKRNETLARTLKIATEEAEKQTALDKEFAAVVDTLANTFQFFKNEVQNLASSIGEDLAPEVKELFKDLTNILKALRGLNERTDGLLSGTLKLTAQVTLLYLAFSKLEKMMKLTMLTSSLTYKAFGVSRIATLRLLVSLRKLKTGFLGLNTAIKATKVSLGGLVAGIWLAVEAGQALGKLIGKLGEVKTAEENLVKTVKKLNKLQKERLKLQEKADGGSKRAAEKLAELDKEIIKQESLLKLFQKQVDFREKAKETPETPEEEKAKEEEQIAQTTGTDFEKEKTDIQNKGIEDRIANAEREAEKLKEIQDGANANEIRALENRNQRISEIEAKKTELDTINSQLRNTAIAESDKQKLELQKTAAELELANLQTNFDIQQEKKVEQDVQDMERSIIAKQMLNQALTEQELLFLEEKKAKDEENREIDLEIKNARAEEDLEFLTNKLLTEKQIEDQVRQERLLKEAKAKNDGLKNEIKYGKAVGKAKTFFDSEEVKGTQKTLGLIGDIKTKEGSAAFKVQKGFAIAEATISTAKAVIDAYTSMVGIPIVGPILAPIAAIAAGIVGAQQIAAISGQNLAFAVGTDSVPHDMFAKIHAKEGIIPAKQNQFLESGKKALIGTDFLENAGLGKNSKTIDTGSTINVNFDGAIINGNIDEDMSFKIAENIASAINESRIAPFPTGIEV